MTVDSVALRFITGLVRPVYSVLPDAGLDALWYVADLGLNEHWIVGQVRGDWESPRRLFGRTCEAIREWTAHWAPWSAGGPWIPELCDVGYVQWCIYRSQNKRKKRPRICME